MDREFTEQELVRRAKLARLVSEGRDPFQVNRVDRTHNTESFAKQFAVFGREELEKVSDNIVLAGRIVAIRQMFLVVQDQFGRAQLLADRNSLQKDAVEVWKSLDLGDIVEATGSPMRTKTGELTLSVRSFRLVSKSLKVLPEKFHGLTDVEERARRRYVDLIVSEKSKETFVARSKIVSAIRDYMDGLGYLEVETPILQDILGGAAARPFVTHHNALDRDYYLRIATELHLKRCIVGGMDKVYEMGRIFRNEGMDASHNPEFTTLEAYAAYQDITDMMALVENMIRYICKKLSITNVAVGEVSIALDKPFGKVHMVDLIKEHSGVDFWKVRDFKEAKKLAEKHGITLQKHQSTVGHIVNLFFEHFCEKECVQPTFVFGHPIEISPFAKKSLKDPRFTERFELFIAGREYANAFSELNDPIDQYERFMAQLDLRAQGDDEANEMDLDFVEALEYGMPPTGGIGIGIDRIVMLLTGTSTIRDVLLFPHMRRRSEV